VDRRSCCDGKALVPDIKTV